MIRLRQLELAETIKREAEEARRSNPGETGMKFYKFPVVGGGYIPDNAMRGKDDECRRAIRMYNQRVMADRLKMEQQAKLNNGQASAPADKNQDNSMQKRKSVTISVPGGQVQLQQVAKPAVNTPTHGGESSAAGGATPGSAVPVPHNPPPPGATPLPPLSQRPLNKWSDDPNERAKNREAVARAIFRGEPANGNSVLLEQMREDTGRECKAHHLVVNTLTSRLDFTPIWIEYKQKDLGGEWIFQQACSVLRGIETAQKLKKKVHKQNQRKRQAIKKANATGGGATAGAGQTQATAVRNTPQTSSGGGSRQRTGATSASTGTPAPIAGAKRPAATRHENETKQKRQKSPYYLKVLESVNIQTNRGPVTKRRHFTVDVGNKIIEAVHRRCAQEALLTWTTPRTCEIKFKLISDDSIEGYVFLIPLDGADQKYYKETINGLKFDDGRTFVALTKAEQNTTTRVTAWSGRGDEGSYMARVLGIETCKQLVCQAPANGLNKLEEHSFKIIGGEIRGERAQRHAYIRAQVDEIAWEQIKANGGYFFVSSERWRVWSGGQPIKADDPFPPNEEQDQQQQIEQYPEQMDQTAAGGDGQQTGNVPDVNDPNNSRPVHSGISIQNEPGAPAGTQGQM